MDKYLREIKERGIIAAVDSRLYRRNGDQIEQSPWELANFCQWIEDHGGLKSYMEIGVSSGGTLKFMADMFKPERIYAADLNAPRRSLTPRNLDFFRGNTFSPEFRVWLSKIPQVDLIWIDADHKYDSVVNDFNACKQVSHKWMAFHDIAGLRGCEGSQQHWKETFELTAGEKAEYKERLCWFDPAIGPVGIGLLVK
jgi:hypothetical protein